MGLPSLKAYQLLHSIKLSYKWIFRQVFRDKNRNVIVSVKKRDRLKQSFISHGRALFKKQTTKYSYTNDVMSMS
jgi:hypothetical protein